MPAPPTFTFAAPYWAAFRADEQPADPTEGLGNPMHSIMGDLFAKGALVAARRAGVHVPPHARGR